MEIDLSGKRALVTGSSRGIGVAIARRLARCGAEIVINGRSDATTRDAVARLAEAVPGARFFAAAGDLGDAGQAGGVFAAAGTIDVLVNNAGVFGNRDAFEIDDDEWMDMFRINVLSAIRAIRHFGPMMRSAGWGRIINIGSEAGIAVPDGLMHYAASKAALHSVSRGFAQALARTGVTVNTVLVGPAAHDEANRIRRERAAAAGLSYDDFEARFFADHRPTSLLRRYVEADEIADLVAFIASREAGFASGAPWRADCGNLTGIA